MASSIKGLNEREERQKNKENEKIKGAKLLAETYRDNVMTEEWHNLQPETD